MVDSGPSPPIMPAVRMSYGISGSTNFASSAFRASSLARKMFDILFQSGESAIVLPAKADQQKRQHQLHEPTEVDRKGQPAIHEGSTFLRREYVAYAGIHVGMEWTPYLHDVVKR